MQTTLPNQISLRRVHVLRDCGPAFINVAAAARDAQCLAMYPVFLAEHTKWGAEMPDLDDVRADAQWQGTAIAPTLAVVKHKVRAAREGARREGAGCTGHKGVLQSRGVHLQITDARGELVQGEAECWAFDGTAAAYRTALAELAKCPMGYSLHVGGGFNWAESPRAMADGDYDAWVSEWSVVLLVNRAAQ